MDNTIIITNAIRLALDTKNKEELLMIIDKHVDTILQKLPYQQVIQINNKSVSLNLYTIIVSTLMELLTPDEFMIILRSFIKKSLATIMNITTNSEQLIYLFTIAKQLQQYEIINYIFSTNDLFNYCIRIDLDEIPTECLESAIINGVLFKHDINYEHVHLFLQKKPVSNLMHIYGIDIIINFGKIKSNIDYGLWSNDIHHILRFISHCDSSLNMIGVVQNIFILATNLYKNNKDLTKKLIDIFAYFCKDVDSKYYINLDSYIRNRVDTFLQSVVKNNDIEFFEYFVRTFPNLKMINIDELTNISDAMLISIVENSIINISTNPNFITRLLNIERYDLVEKIYLKHKNTPYKPIDKYIAKKLADGAIDTIIAMSKYTFFEYVYIDEKYIKIIINNGRYDILSILADINYNNYTDELILDMIECHHNHPLLKIIVSNRKKIFSENFIMALMNYLDRPIVFDIVDMVFDRNKYVFSIKCLGYILNTHNEKIIYKMKEVYKENPYILSTINTFDVIGLFDLFISYGFYIDIIRLLELSIYDSNENLFEHVFKKYITEKQTKKELLHIVDGKITSTTNKDNFSLSVIRGIINRSIQTDLENDFIDYCDNLEYCTDDEDPDSE